MFLFAFLTSDRFLLAFDVTPSSSFLWNFPASSMKTTLIILDNRYGQNVLDVTGVISGGHMRTCVFNIDASCSVDALRIRKKNKK